MSHTQTAPEWFNRALAVNYETRHVDVQGCNIEYLRWGDPSNPALSSSMAMASTLIGGILSLLFSVTTFVSVQSI